MKNVVAATAAAMMMAGAAVLAPSQAEAGCWGCAVGAGIVGGAIIGGAIASTYAYPHVYYPAPGYVAYPAYAGPPPVACPGGYWARRPVLDRWGNVIGYSRPRFFCPG